MPIQKFKYLRDTEKYCCVHNSVWKINNSLSIESSYQFSTTFFFLMSLIPVFRPPKIGFTNVDEDQDSKNLCFNIRVIFTLLFGINILLPKSCRALGSLSLPFTKLKKKKNWKIASLSMWLWQGNLNDLRYLVPVTELDSHQDH